MKPASILIDPRYLDLYSQPVAALNERQLWRLRIHGLRHVMLHPSVWGTRLHEMTENRQMIPMKLFVLRSSELESYRLHSIKFNFSFRKISRSHIQKNPRDHDPLLEVGLAGECRRGEPGKQPLVDRGYVLRFSSIPTIPSGLYYHSLSTYQLIKAASPEVFVTGERSNVAINVTSKGLHVTLNGEEYIHYQGDSFEKGYVTIRGGWHPSYFNQLKLEGSIKKGSERVTVNESGLLPRLPPKINKAEPALKQIPVL